MSSPLSIIHGPHLPLQTLRAAVVLSALPHIPYASLSYQCCRIEVYTDSPTRRYRDIMEWEASSFATSPFPRTNSLLVVRSFLLLKKLLFSERISKETCLCTRTGVVHSVIPICCNGKPRNIFDVVRKLFILDIAYLMEWRFY